MTKILLTAVNAKYIHSNPAVAQSARIRKGISGNRDGHRDKRIHDQSSDRGYTGGNL